MTGRRDPRRGAALMSTIIILTGLLAAASMTAYLVTAETRSTAYTTMARRSLFCAEAGLAVARPIAAANYATWTQALDADPSNDPPWYPITGHVELAALGPVDFEVTLRDNDDELPPLDNDPARDNDLRVFIVARCTKYPEHPRTVMELIEYSAAGHTYRNQAGQGGFNTGNAN